LLECWLEEATMVRGRLNLHSEFGDVWLHVLLVFALIVLSGLLHSHRAAPAVARSTASALAPGQDPTPSARTLGPR